MHQYRLFNVDGDQVAEIKAAGDAEATTIAKAMHKPMRCQLWNRYRLVAVIPGTSERE